MNGQRFTVTRDHRVLASGFELGRIYEHPNLDTSFPRKAAKWFAVHPDAGIVDITSDMDRAALQVARAAGYPDATLLDLDHEVAE